MHKVFLPRLGQTMEEGLLARWLVDVGVDYQPGEALYEVETDKVTAAVEASLPGRLLRVLVEEESVQPVGALLAVAADPGESVTPAAVDAFLAGVDPAGAPEDAERAAPAGASGVEKGIDGTRSDGGDGPARAMPRTRALAKRHGLDLADVVGTGRDGLITEHDVRAHISLSAAPSSGAPCRIDPSAPTPSPMPVPPPAPSAPAVIAGATPDTGAQPAAAAVLDGPRLRERRVLSPVARRMAQVVARSAAEIPQFSQSVDVHATRWRAWRDRLRAETGLPIGYNDIVLDALVRALRDVPDANATFHGDSISIWQDVNVSIAVDTPAGLQVPVLHAVNEYTIAGRASRFQSLVERARRNELTLDDVQGGTITLSNLGMFGVHTGVPMVTLPQSCIVFVGAMRESVVALDGGMAVRPVVTVTNAFDHRALDGATAARFTAAFARHLATEPA